MLTGRTVAVVGSRDFRNYEQIKKYLDSFLKEDDTICSGGAAGADSMAQRYAKESGRDILILYPNWDRYGRGAGFQRNRRIATYSDVILVFYARDRFQLGGSANAAEWGRKLEKEVIEFEEEKYG